MTGLKQYAVVRVRQLLHAAEHYDGWRVNRRPPQLGDRGTIVEILSAPGVPDDFVVECTGRDGIAVWLGDFSAEELEPAEEPPNKALDPTAVSVSVLAFVGFTMFLSYLDHAVPAVGQLGRSAAAFPV